MSRPRDPRQRSTARRPLLDGRGRRSLSNVGGPVTTVGESAMAGKLAEAFAVRAGERDATLTHPFHAYPARLHPEVARALIALGRARVTDPQGNLLAVLDPCCGSGTVLIEAMVTGARAVGTDLSPLAIELARLKTRVTTDAQRKAIVEGAHQLSRAAAARVRAHGKLRHPRGEERWYLPHTLAELSALVGLIAEVPDGIERDAYRMLLSSILVKVSRQRSDSDSRLISRPVAPGAAVHWFARKSFELASGLEALAKATPPGTPEVDAHADNALRLASIADASVDVVISSPPYANTYDYIAHHTRRYHWLRLDASALGEHEIGAQRWFEVPEAGVMRFQREMSSMAGALARVVRPGGLAFLVIADAAAAGKPLPADEALATAIRGTAWELAARVSQERPTFDPESARAFPRRPKREHLVALRRG